MDWKTILIATILVMSAIACGGAEEPAKKPVAEAAKPAEPAATAPALPALPAVVATVGTAKITREQVEAPLKNAPPGVSPEQLAAARGQIIADMITREMVHAYVEAKKVPCDPNELTKVKEDIATAATRQNTTPAKLMQSAGLTEERLRDHVRMKALSDQVAGEKQIDALLKEHPSYFNGTKVQASHVLLACEPHAPTKDQQAAVAKLKKIGADIAAGTTTFEQAAGEHSACPSGKRDKGSLGEFTFDRMVPPFSMQAFGMKIGEVSGVVRTQFGFHIIKVTKRTDGEAAPGPEARKTAERALMAQLQNRIFDQALTTCPIVMTP